MLTHIRQDIAIRALPGWLVFGPFLNLGLAFMILLYGSILIRYGLLSAAVIESWMLWLPWLPPAIYLAYAQWRRRASDLDLALPLPARRLWLAHGLSLGLASVAILVLSVTLMALMVTQVTPGMIAVFLRLAAGLVIAVALLAGREPALVRLTASPTNILLVAAVLIGVPVLVLRLGDGWVLALLGLALALGFRTWRSLPAALTLEPAACPPPSAGAGVPEIRKFRQPSVAPGRGSIFLRVQSAGARQRLLLYCLLYPALVLLGILSAGFALSGRGEAVIFVPLFTVYLLMLATRVTTSQLAMLDALPISRRFLFAAMVVPSSAAWLLAYGAMALLVVVSGGVRVGAREVMILAVIPVLTGVLWFCLIALSLRSPNRRYTSGMTPFYALVSALVVLVLLLGVAIELGWLEPDAPVAFIRLLATALPDGKATPVVLAILVLGTGYALAEARFRRFEVAPQRGEPETLGGV